MRRVGMDKIAWAALLAGLLPGATAASEAVVTVRKSDCRMVMRHAPEAGADYVPGRDVYGRPVAPADVSGGQPDVLRGGLSFDITVDGLERYGVADRFPAVEGNAHVATLALRGDQVYFNGQPLQQTEHRGMVALCRERFPDLR